MAETPKKLDDNPKDALEAYLRYMWRGYYKWYETAVARDQKYWIATQSIVVLSGFGTAVLAALSGEDWFDRTRAWRVVLIVLPLIGAFSASLAANSKVAARWALRERGRQALQRLVDHGRQRFAAASAPAEYSEIHAALVREVAAVEAAQGEGYFLHLADTATPPDRAASPPG